MENNSQSTLQILSSNNKPDAEAPKATTSKRSGGNVLILATNSKIASGNDYRETPPPRDEEESNGQIRIKINKNKSILDHLAKFTRDLSNAIEGDEQEGGKGMTLLFYDFNGSKSSLSSRSNPNQKK